MRVRGLKLICQRFPIERIQSHPMRVRGLKLCFHLVFVQITHVAPHAGAWIETHCFFDY